MAKKLSKSKKAVKAKVLKAAKKPAKPAKSVKAAKPGKSTVTKAGSTPPKIAMRSVTGQLVLGEAAKAMDWYAKCLGAKELSRILQPDGKVMHGQMRIGDTNFMVSDAFGPAPPQMNGAYLHIHDAGIQTMWDRAMANGATAVLPLANQFWGDKYGQLRDPFGQLWSFGWPAKMTKAEQAKLQAETMAYMDSLQKK